jgi:hypothetical protein
MFVSRPVGIQFALHEMNKNGKKRQKLLKTPMFVPRCSVSACAQRNNNREKRPFLSQAVPGAGAGRGTNITRQHKHSA